MPPRLQALASRASWERMRHTELHSYACDKEPLPGGSGEIGKYDVGFAVSDDVLQRAISYGLVRTYVRRSVCVCVRVCVRAFCACVRRMFSAPSFFLPSNA